MSAAAPVAGLAAETLRLTAALLLLAAAWGKWRALGHFRDNLSATFGVGTALAAALAPGIAAAEALLGLGLLAGGTIGQAALAASLLLFAVFTAAVAWKYATEDIVKCSCFGDADRSVSGFDLARNFAVICGIACSLALGAVSGGTWQATVCAAGVATLLAVLLANFHEIMMLLWYAKEGAV